MSSRRVLLVEDDPSLQRFVAMVLEDLAVDLRICGHVGSALQALAEQPVDLLITDLMLPDRSGQELLAELQARPALRGQARLVAFSAGLQPQVRSQLQALGVERMLFKPCPVSELEACIEEALGPVPAALAPTAAAPAAPAPDLASLAPDLEAIQRNFGGDMALYRGFRAASLQQFTMDRAEGERACAARELATVRRLAHSLKSVLLILGLEASSDLAARLERQLEAALSAGQPWPAGAEALWAELSAQLQTLSEDAAAP